MTAALYYGTPMDQYVPTYGEHRLFSGNEKKITTQLPKNIALVRVIATLALTALFAIRWQATIFCLPLIAAGAAFAAWTIYTHLLTKDPLIEIFYQVVGGKDRFFQLPEIKLEQAPNEKASSALRRTIGWDKLIHPMYRATTLDGRKILIVKGFSRTPQTTLGTHAKSTFLFVEKVGPKDIPRKISNMPELVASVGYAIFDPFKGNTFGRLLSSSQSAGSLNNGDIKTDFCQTKICASITTSMANEFFAQMQARNSTENSLF